jgi:hypothetical protein
MILHNLNSVEQPIKAEPRGRNLEHESGRVRGLLCRKCNRGIGLFSDSLELLQSAITYLGGTISAHKNNT